MMKAAAAFAAAVHCPLDHPMAQQGALHAFQILKVMAMESDTSST
jgi:hypothetical protein